MLFYGIYLSTKNMHVRSFVRYLMPYNSVMLKPCFSTYSGGERDGAHTSKYIKRETQAVDYRIPYTLHKIDGIATCIQFNISSLHLMQKQTTATQNIQNGETGTLQTVRSVRRTPQHGKENRP